MNVYDYILSPVVTEKSINFQKLSKYSFYVRKSANKIEIAKAISKIYGVEVKNVNITKLPQKTKIAKRGKTISKRPFITKAIVTLKKNQTIDFTKIKDLKK